MEKVKKRREGATETFWTGRWNQLLPFALAGNHAMVAMAIGAEWFFVVGAVQNGLVVDFFLAVSLELIALHQFNPVVAAQAFEPDLAAGVHDVGRRAVAAGSPGFIGNMRIGGAVAGGASNVGAGMDDRECFHHEIDVTNLAPAVVRTADYHKSVGSRFVVQQ